jgi:hypothetical protein
LYPDLGSIILFCGQCDLPATQKAGLLAHPGMAYSDARKAFLRGMSNYTAKAELIITKFKLNGDEAIMDVWLKDKYFETDFMTKTKLIKEDGQWRWYGNQLPN